MIEVTAEEFRKFIAEYPNKLTFDTKHFCTPPVMVWMDGDEIVAKEFVEFWNPKDSYFIKKGNDNEMR